MARTDVSAAINSTIDPAVTYHTDPRGATMVRRLTASIADVIAGRTGQWVYRATPTFNGYAPSPQRMIGAARLGNARPVVSRASTLTDQKEASPLNDTAARMFYERMQRGRS